MIKRWIRFIFLCSILLLGFSVGLSFAQNQGNWQARDDPFQIIPEAKDDEFWKKVQELWQPDPENNFWNRYNEHGDAYTQDKDLWAQLASWIVTWDTILLLLVRVVKFIANAWLVVGSAMVIYAWYLYVTAVYTWMESNTWKAKEAIKDAVIGIVIIIFSYAIQRVITQAFLA